MLSGYFLLLDVFLLHECHFFIFVLFSMLFSPYLCFMNSVCLIIFKVSLIEECHFLNHPVLIINYSILVMKRKLYRSQELMPNMKNNYVIFTLTPKKLALGLKMLKKKDICFNMMYKET